MQKHLYMVCPTDHLEPIIDSSFKGLKAFYTSLGNTMAMDRLTLKQIAVQIEKDNIQEITFVLSEDNHIVLDALNHQNFIEITTLKKAYPHFVKHQKTVTDSWQVHFQHAMILSYHLNEKIKELKRGLQGFPISQPLINGKLYSKAYRNFRQIYPHLTCINTAHLN